MWQLYLFEEGKYNPIGRKGSYQKVYGDWEWYAVKEPEKRYAVGRLGPEE